MDKSLRKSLRSGNFNKKESEPGEGLLSAATVKRKSTGGSSSRGPSPAPSPRGSPRPDADPAPSKPAADSAPGGSRHGQKRDSIAAMMEGSFIFETVDNGEILIEGMVDISKGKKFSERFVRLRELAIEYFGIEDQERTIPRGHVRLSDMGEITQFDESFSIEVMGRDIEFRPRDKTSVDNWVLLLQEAMLAAKRPDEPSKPWPADFGKTSPQQGSEAKSGGDGSEKKTIRGGGGRRPSQGGEGEEENWPPSQRHEVCVEPDDQGYMVLLNPVELSEGQFLNVGTIICGCNAQNHSTELGHAPKIRLCRAAFSAAPPPQKTPDGGATPGGGGNSLSRSAQWGCDVSPSALEQVKKGRAAANLRKSRSTGALHAGYAASTAAMRERKAWKCTGPVAGSKTSKPYVPEILKATEITQKVPGYVGPVIRPQEWEKPVTRYEGRILRQKEAPPISAFTGPKHRFESVTAKVGSKEMDAIIREDTCGRLMHAKYDKIFAKS